jgi:hypothetical protein
MFLHFGNFWRGDKPTDVKGVISYGILPINQPPIQDSENTCLFTFRFSLFFLSALKPQDVEAAIVPRPSMVPTRRPNHFFAGKLSL